MEKPYWVDNPKNIIGCKFWTIFCVKNLYLSGKVEIMMQKTIIIYILGGIFSKESYEYWEENFHIGWKSSENLTSEPPHLLDSLE